MEILLWNDALLACGYQMYALRDSEALLRSADRSTWASPDRLGRMS